MRVRKAALAMSSRRSALIPTLIRACALADRDLEGKRIPKRSRHGEQREDHHERSDC